MTSPDEDARTLRWAVAAAAATIVCLAAVFSGQHHVVDVVAGAALGIAGWSLAKHLVDPAQRIRRRA